MRVPTGFSIVAWHDSAVSISVSPWTLSRNTPARTELEPRICALCPYESAHPMPNLPSLSTASGASLAWKVRKKVDIKHPPQCRAPFQWTFTPSRAHGPFGSHQRHLVALPAPLDRGFSQPGEARGFFGCGEPCAPTAMGAMGQRLQRCRRHCRLRYWPV